MNDYKNEALAALPGAEWSGPSYDPKACHAKRGICLYPPTNGLGWHARFHWGDHANGSTPALALANLRAKITGDDLKRAFPEPAKLEREPYRDADPFGTRRAIAERKPEVPAVPPELVEWQPGEWVWEENEWRNGEITAWECPVYGPSVDHPDTGTYYGVTYAEAIADLRAGALRAAGCATLVAEERPRVTWRVEEQARHRKTMYVASLHINGVKVAGFKTEYGVDVAVNCLKMSTEWRTCTALGFTPEREQ